MSHPTHPFGFDHPNTTLCEENKLQSSSLCNCFHPVGTSCVLSPDIPLSTLFIQTLNLCASLKKIEQVSHPNKTTGK
jgi:hypothetical protein